MQIRGGHRRGKVSKIEFLLPHRRQQLRRGQNSDGFQSLKRSCSLPRSKDDCLQELRWMYDWRDLGEVRRDLVAWVGKWQAGYAKLCSWVEDNIEETLTNYRLPLAPHKNMKSTNMLERLNQELKRRTHVVRIFPNAASCLRLVRALAVETHENWLEAILYLNMEHLKEHKKLAARLAA